MKFFITIALILLLSSCATTEPAYMERSGWRRSNGYRPTRSQWRTYKQGWRVENDCPSTRGKVGY